MDSPGIILRTTPFRDADIILHVLTPDRGKVSVIARSARASKKKYGSQLEPFDQGTFTLRQGKGNIPYVDNFISKQSHRKLREDLNKLSLASLLCEATDKMLMEEMTDDSKFLYDSLCLHLYEVAYADDIKKALKSSYFYLSLLLSISGYLDTEKTPLPSANNLQKLITQIEHSIETELKSKSAVAMVLQSIKTSIAA